MMTIKKSVTTAARHDFLLQVTQQPIKFTIGGFYTIDRNFAVSVRSVAMIHF